jgi:hypothetical protein
MNADPRITVVIRATEPARIAEALRAAVGLGLRGALLSVVLPHALAKDDARYARSLATLRALAHDVDATLSSVRSADAVEVWT